MLYNYVIYENNYGIYNNNYKLLDQNYTYVIHNTTDKTAQGKVSLHLNACACPFPIEERKWGWAGVVARGHVPPLKSHLKAVNRGGFRRRDTARGHPSNPPSRSSATPKPPLYYLPLCAQGTPFTHPPSLIFQGHSFTKDNNWNCYLFFVF